MENERYWFPAKRYGWGWGLPLVWQGWVVMGVWVGVMVGALVLLAMGGVAAYAMVVGVATVGLIGVCYWKGERPRWRWGGE